MAIPQQRFQAARWSWIRGAIAAPVLASAVFALGCKNTPQGPVPIWNTPNHSTAPQSDPLFGPATPNVSPPAGALPPGNASPVISGTTQPLAPLPGMHAPSASGSPAALATGTTGQLNNPRDPSANPAGGSAPTLLTPIPNPGTANTNPIQLRQPEPAPPANWSNPAQGGFNPGNAPPPSPPPGSINPTTSLSQPGQNGLTSLQNNLNQTIQQGQNSLNSLQNNVNQTVQQGQRDWNNMANSANATANQYKQNAVNAQQQLVNQGKQIQTDLTNQANSSYARLAQQLNQQGQQIDAAMQSTLASLDDSLRKQGMVWQNVQKQADGSWKSVASFADPNNPANRRTMEAVASTPEAAMRALLGEAGGAPRAPATGFSPTVTGAVPAPAGGYPPPLPGR